MIDILFIVGGALGLLALCAPLAGYALLAWLRRAGAVRPARPAPYWLGASIEAEAEADQLDGRAERYARNPYFVHDAAALRQRAAALRATAANFRQMAAACYPKRRKP